MQVRSDRRHTFPVSPDELWEAMARVDEYQEWWPWLRDFDAPGLTTGAVWRAVVQPPLPYRLRFELQLDEVTRPRLVSAAVSGDITGSAQLEITPKAGGSDLHLVSELAPTNATLRAVARVARPLVQFGHDWVLDTGLRQFRALALPVPAAAADDIEL